MFQFEDNRMRDSAATSAHSFTAADSSVLARSDASASAGWIVPISSVRKMSRLDGKW